MSERVERELLLTASAEEVWELLMDPSGWLADDAAIELRPGGDAWFRIGEEVRTGWVEEVARAERLAFWWSNDDEPASRVELTLEELESGTRLRVVETRPLEVLDLVAIPLARHGGPTYGPALIAA